MTHDLWPSCAKNCCWTSSCNLRELNILHFQKSIWNHQNQWNNWRASTFMVSVFVVVFFNVDRLTKEEQLQHREEAQTQIIVGLVKKEITWQFPHYRQAETKGRTEHQMASDGAVQLSDQAERKAEKCIPDPFGCSGLLTRKYADRVHISHTFAHLKCSCGFIRRQPLI